MTNLLPILLFTALTAPAQEYTKVDSLIQVLETGITDKKRVNAYNALAKAYWGSDSLKTADYTSKAINLAKEINYPEGISDAYYRIGVVTMRSGDHPKATELYKQALTSAQEASYKKGEGNAYNGLGVIHKLQGNYPKALEYYFKSLKTDEETGNEDGMSLSYNNIGIIYKNQGNYSKAIKYYFKSLKIDQKTGDKSGIAASYNNIGSAYANQGNYPKALEYYFKTLKIDKELGNKRGVAMSYNNIGDVYRYKEKYLEAIEYSSKALIITKEIGDKDNQISALISLGSAYREMKQYAKAIQHLTAGLTLAQEVGLAGSTRKVAEALAKTYEATGDYKAAYQSHVLFKQMVDSLRNEENTKKLTQQAMQYEFDKQQAMAKAKQKRKDLIQQQKLKQRNYIIYGVGLGLLSILVFTIFLFRNYQQKQKANKLLAEQKREIQDQAEELQFAHEQLSLTHNRLEKHHNDIAASINYAKNLQSAILPSRNALQDTLRDGFIFFYPRDVVSGDFYWMETHTHNQQETVYYAVADCTGHGVPGAMVSVVCSHALERAVKEFELRTPGKILDKVTELVIQRFEKSGAEVKDGMDIALCAIQWDTMKLQYAGANNPLWIVRERSGEEEFSKKDVFNETHYLIEYKANRQPIGKYPRHLPFDNIEIDLQANDRLYTFSDGYVDQFGGAKNKKFMSKNFKRLLVKTASVPMDEQKQIIEKTFFDWKINEAQIDDVCVIGVRVAT